MEDLNTATGETPSATESVNDAPVETSTQPETQQTAATEEFSPGWSMDDNAEPETATELTDEQIAELTKDPALDQTKVPGLVQQLRDKYAVEKRQKAEIAALRQQLAAFEQYGGVEGAGQMAGLANGLIRDPQKGVGEFLTTLSKQSLPAYQGIADALIEYEHEYLVSALQRAGKLPEPQQPAGQLTAEDWGKIPQDLHEIAKQIPVNELINWLDNGNEQTLRMMLETRKELSDLKGAQRDQAEQAWRASVQQAQEQGTQSIQSLSDQYLKAHFAQFAKWQPFGPTSEQQNQQLYTSILQGAHAMLLQDPQWQQMHQDAVNKLSQAPLRRLRNEHMAADADERDARGLAARYNARLGQVMKGLITSLDSVFRDARAYRESQKQNIPNRTEISGQSTQTGQNGAPPTLLANGKTNPAYLEYVIANVNANTGRQG